jgi:hypothetical protein
MNRAPCRTGQTESIREKFKENARRAADRRAERSAVV